MKYDELIGQSTGFRKINYNWRDSALYALGVGAGKYDLQYTYEKDMKAIPTYGTIPVFCAVNNEPQRPLPDPAASIAKKYLVKMLGKDFTDLHLGLEFFYYRPIDPIKGTMVFEDKISQIYDWGDRGTVVETSLDVFDEAGRKICTNVSRVGLFAGGNFGGPTLPKNPVKIPDREPDFVEDDQFSPVQNVLYRLSGDTNIPHIDPDVAKEWAGQPWAFMQGLCSYGFACRMAIKHTIPTEPERMKHMNAEMRSIALPEDEIQLQGWNIEEGKVCFRLVNKGTGKPILDKGIFEWA